MWSSWKGKQSQPELLQFGEKLSHVVALAVDLNKLVPDWIAGLRLCWHFSCAQKQIEEQFNHVLPFRHASSFFQKFFPLNLKFLDANLKLLVVDDEGLDLLIELLAVSKGIDSLVDLFHAVLLLGIVVVSSESLFFLVIFVLQLFVLMTYIGEEWLQTGYLLMQKLYLSISGLGSFKISFVVLCFYFVRFLLQNCTFLFQHANGPFQFNDLMLVTVDKGVFNWYLFFIPTLLCQKLFLDLEKLLIEGALGDFRFLQDAGDSFLFSLDLTLKMEQLIAILHFRWFVRLEFNLHWVEFCFDVSKFSIKWWVFVLKLVAL